MSSNAPCWCYPQGNDGDCPAPGCYAGRARNHDKPSPLVERAVQRLRDNIARREATEDVEALKTVLLELDRLRSSAPSATVPPGPNSHDWTEDYAHENGQYQCRCVNCRCMFYGHKRRHVCKQCAQLSSAVTETAPIQAHSKTEFKRLSAQGANVLPPSPRAEADADQAKDAARYRHLREYDDFAYWLLEELQKCGYHDLALWQRHLDSAIDTDIQRRGPSAP